MILRLFRQAYSVFAACVATGYNVHIMIYHFMQNFGKYAPFVFADREPSLLPRSSDFYRLIYHV